MGDNNSLGRTIRLLRKEKRLTQEQLAEGICSPVTISRIENGRQMPTKSVLDDLLSRLGTNIYQICDAYYTTERDNAFAEVIEYADAALRRGNVDEARKLLDTVDEPSRERPPYRQLYLMMSARMLITPHGERLDEALCLLEQSISLTRPSLCLNDFRHAFLSLNEAKCIGLMIPTLCYLERYPDASRLGEELVRSMDNQGNKTQGWVDEKIGCELNLALSLEREGRYEDSLHYLRRANGEAIDNGILTYMPNILYARARIAYRRGQKDESLHILRVIAPYMDLTGQHDYAEAVRQWAWENIGREL